MSNRFAFGRADDMWQWIKSLSPTFEFMFVILIGFGWFVTGSVSRLAGTLAGGTTEQVTVFSNNTLYTLAIYEIVALLVIGTFLILRGWSVKDFNLQSSWARTGAGLLLAILDYILYVVLTYLAIGLSLVSFDQLESGLRVRTEGVNFVSAVTVSVINAIYEEVLVVGYVMIMLRRRAGVGSAIGVSVLIRALYHLYQGPFVLLSIIPMGLLFAGTYARWGKLWPLVVAHMLMDTIAILAHSVP